MTIALKLLLAWFVAGGVLAGFHARRGLLAAWHEPVLSRPVLVIESDDWGAGPAQQAPVLRAIARVLDNFTDGEGRHPVMTLGMILASADGEKSLDGEYQRQTLSPERDAELLAALAEGVGAGVFSLQLHGMEHFWPPALMAASRTDETVRNWLAAAPRLPTEELPAPLQSRWVDASVLPARSLDGADIATAAGEEVDCFERIFGMPPRVAVPPTFVWNDHVEEAWARAGIHVVITPGRRYETRDAEGRPAAEKGSVRNGQYGRANIVYLVRDLYFEPSFGHSAAAAIDDLVAKSRLGRPALFETHRFNFLAAEAVRNGALAELERLLQAALERCPDLAFLSSEQLAGILENRDPRWVETRFARRLHVWLARAAELPRLRKLAWITGWIAPAGLAWKLTA